MTVLTVFWSRRASLIPLAAALINLINNYDYAKLLGENARKRSIGRHDPDLIVKQLVGIYETILTENGR